MTLTSILLLIIIGIVAGMLSGLVGVGGGIIIVPALVYILHFSQKQAQGTSLAVLALPVVAVAVFQYHKAGHINIKYIPFIAIGFLVGGYFGSKISIALPEATVKKIFAILLLLIAVKMLFFDNEQKKEITTHQH
jgi:uncharacterized membrane protein YfcA